MAWALCRRTRPSNLRLLRIRSGFCHDVPVLVPVRRSLRPIPRVTRPCAAAFGIAVAVTLLGAPAEGASTPKPKAPSTPTLPVLHQRLDPSASVGGPKLASMGVVVDRPAWVPAPPTMRDLSWLIADAGTGEVVAAKAPHARLLPASTLKTLTSLVVMPKVSAAGQYTVKPEDVAVDGTRVGLVPGYSYSGKQLFEGMLMSSGNDTAYALARIAGGKEATVAAMNSEAALLGAHDTVARDPSGLDAPGQTSSAYDLALFGRAALQLPAFRTYVTTKQAPFPGRKDKKGKRGSYLIQSHNKLLYNYPGTIGVKNGYTLAAHRTFIAAAKRGTRTYIVSEMYGLDNSWRPTAALLDWAFSYGAKVTPVGRLVAPGEVTTSPAPTTAPARSSASPSAPGGRMAALAKPPPAHGSVIDLTRGPGRALALGVVALVALCLLGAGLFNGRVDLRYPRRH